MNWPTPLSNFKHKTHRVEISVATHDWIVAYFNFEKVIDSLFSFLITFFSTIPLSRHLSFEFFEPAFSVFFSKKRSILFFQRGCYNLLLRGRVFEHNFFLYDTSKVKNKRLKVVKGCFMIFLKTKDEPSVSKSQVFFSLKNPIEKLVCDRIFCCTSYERVTSFRFRAGDLFFFS